MNIVVVQGTISPRRHVAGTLASGHQVRALELNTIDNEGAPTNMHIVWDGPTPDIDPDDHVTVIGVIIRRAYNDHGHIRQHTEIRATAITNDPAVVAAALTAAATAVHATPTPAAAAAFCLTADKNGTTIA